MANRRDNRDKWARLRQIQEEIYRKKAAEPETEEQEVRTVADAVDDLHSTARLEERATRRLVESHEDFTSSALELLGAESDEPKLLKSIDEHLREFASAALDLITQSEPVEAVSSTDESVDKVIQNTVDESVSTVNQNEETAKKLSQEEKDHLTWEKSQARTEEFEEEYYRTVEFDLLREIRDAISDSSEASAEAQKKADRKPSGEDSDGLAGFLLPAGLGAMLGGAGKLALRFAGPLALIAGVFSFVDGFSNAEEVLGHAPRHFADKLAAGGAQVISSFVNAVGTLANLFLPENLQLPELSPQAVVQATRDAWSSSVSYLKNNSIPEMIGGATDALEAGARVAVDGLSGIMGSVAGLLLGGEAGAELEQSTRDILGGVVDTAAGFTSLYGKLWNNTFGDGSEDLDLQESFSELRAGTMRTLSGFASGVATIFGSVLEVTGMEEPFNELADNLGAGITDFTNRMSGLWDRIVDEFDYEGMRETATRMFSDMRSSISGFTDRISSFFMKDPDAESITLDEQELGRDSGQTTLPDGTVLETSGAVQPEPKDMAVPTNQPQSTEEPEFQPQPHFWVEEPKDMAVPTNQPQSTEEPEFQPQPHFWVEEPPAIDLQRSRRELEQAERAIQILQVPPAASNNSSVIQQNNNSRTNVQEIRTPLNPNRHQTQTPAFGARY